MNIIKLGYGKCEIEWKEELAKIRLVRDKVYTAVKNERIYGKLVKRKPMGKVVDRKA